MSKELAIGSTKEIEPELFGVMKLFIHMYTRSGGGEAKWAPGRMRLGISRQGSKNVRPLIYELRKD